MIVTQAVVGHHISHLTARLAQLLQLEPVLRRLHTERTLQRQQTVQLGAAEHLLLLMKGTQVKQNLVTVLIEGDIVRCTLTDPHQTYLRCHHLKRITGD